MQTRKITLIVAVAASTGLLLAGCGSSESTPTEASVPSASASTSTAPSESSVEAPAGQDPAPQAETMIIDVRTPEEFAAGHVSGAVNIDINGPAFQTTLDGLDKNAEYFVYCRSGNRSGVATQTMLNMGFTNVTDLGPVENAAEQLEAPIVS